MKLAGITLIWVGVIMLMKAIGLIQVVDANIIWAVVVIILGFALKYKCHHGMMCKMMGRCKEEGKSTYHKCTGADCPVCNK